MIPGTNLGQYRIIEQVGKGGMATVYRAYQANLDRDVAIKVIPQFLADEPGFIERFRREAVVVASLNHPNIMVVHDTGVEDAQPYIVYEFVDGGTLQERLGQPWSPADAVAMARPIAAALDYAHQRDIVHRDIKPSNILIASDGRAVLADFGLARMFAGASRLTMSGTTLGTPEYMSPEQAMDSGVGPASDVYSLGIILYEMLVGQIPYSADTPMAVALAHIHDPLPLPRERNPDISPKIERVLLKTLAKDPEARYAGAVELMDALEIAAGDQPQTAPPVVPAEIGMVETELAESVTGQLESEAEPARPEQVEQQRGQEVPARSRRRFVLAAAAALVTVAILLGVLAATGVFAGEEEPAGQAAVEQATAEPTTAAPFAEVDLSPTVAASSPLEVGFLRPADPGELPALPEGASAYVFKVAGLDLDELDDAGGLAQALSPPPEVVGFDRIGADEIVLVLRPGAPTAEYTAQFQAPDGRQARITFSHTAADPTAEAEETATTTQAEFSISFVQQINPRTIPDLPRGLLPYVFQVDGPEFGTVSRDQLEAVLDLPDWSVGWEFVDERQITFVLFMSPLAPSDTYSVAIDLPDGQRFETAFPHQAPEQPYSNDQFEIAFVRKIEAGSIPNVPPDASPYLFQVRGVALHWFPPERLDSAFNPPAESVGWAVPEQAQNSLLVLMPNDAPAGDYMVAFELPDGTRRDASFRHVAEESGAAAVDAERPPGVVQMIETESRALTGVSFRRDGRLLATADDANGTVSVWDPVSGRLRRTFEAEESVVDVAFSPRGLLLASAGGGTVELWNIQQDEPIRRLDVDLDISTIAFSPSGAILSIGSYDGAIEIWQTSDWTRVGSLLESGDKILTVAFSPDGKLVAAGSDTGAILVFDLESGGKLLKSIVAHEDAVTSLEFSPDGQFILTSSDDSSLAISSVESGEPVVLHGDFAGDVTSMALNSDATIAAVGLDNGSVALIEPESGVLLGEIAGHSGLVVAVAFSPDGSLGASISSGGTLAIWEPAAVVESG